MTDNVDMVRLIVSDLEEQLATVSDLLQGMCLIGEALDVDRGGAVQRIAGLTYDHSRAAEELRHELFRLTHPNRAHFEKEGWPA